MADLLAELEAVQSQGGTDLLAELGQTQKGGVDLFGELDTRKKDWLSERAYKMNGAPFENVDYYYKQEFKEGADPKQYQQILDKPFYGQPMGRVLKDRVELFSKDQGITREEGAEYVTKRLPFVGAAISGADAFKTYKAAKRVEAGEPSEEDVNRVASYLARAGAESENGVGARILDIVTRLPGYGVEFGLTGGAFTAGRKAAMAGAEKALGSAAGTLAGRAAAQAVGATAGVAAQTAASPQRVFESATARLVPQDVQITPDGGVKLPGKDEDLITALPKGFLDTFIEMGSERTGAALAKPLGKLKSFFANKWIGKVAGRTPEAFNEVLKKAGWHGVVGEMFEERVGDVARAATGLQTWEQAVPTAQQLVAEAVAFSIPGAAGRAASWAQQHPEAAAKLASIETPSRKDFQEAGLPGGSKQAERQQFAEELRGATRGSETGPSYETGPTPVQPQPVPPQPQEPINALPQQAQEPAQVQSAAEPAAPEENRQVEPEVLGQQPVALPQPQVALPQPEAAPPQSLPAPPPASEPLSEPPRGTKLGIAPPGALPLDQITKDVRKGKSRAASFVRRFFTTRGDLPPEAHEAKIAKDAWINSQLKEIEFTLNDFEKAAKQAYGGSAQIAAKERAELDAVLKGQKKSETLPAAMRAPVLRMRNEIDALSRKLIDSGAIEGPLSITVEENMGVYATRSYRVFDDPNWAEKVDPEVRNKAKALLRSEYPDWNDNQLEQLINALLYQDKAAETPIAVLRRSKLGSKDLSITKHRKEIAPEIRALWGEYDDPRVNYARSVTKMAHLIGNHRFLAEVKENGLGKFFFKEGDPDINPEAKAKIAADASETMYPLNGLVTFPDVKRAFEREYAKQALPTWLRWWMRFNGFAKYSKTVLSAITHARNFVSNIPIVVGQGHWRVTKLGDAYKGTRPGVESTLPTTPDAWRDFHRRLTELGVVDESVHVGELQGVLQDAFDMTPDQFTDSTIRRTVRKAGKGAADAYQAGDTFWKVYAWANERARYSKAKPELKGEALDKAAAKIVRDTLPTYSMIPEGVKLLRRFPLVGPFVSFASERFRNFAKTLEIIGTELKDPATRGIAAERIAGQLAKYGLYAGAAVASRFLVGVSGDDEEDMREFVAPWNKNSTLVWLDRDSFVDLSYTDPDSALAKPFMAFLRGDDWGEAFADAAAELATPFISEELVTERLLDIARNKKKSGSEVYSPQASIGDKAIAMAGHIWEAIEPGTVASVKRIKKGVTGEVEQGGRSYDPAAEAIGMVTGFRAQEINVPQSLGFKANAYATSLRDANRILTRAATNRGTVTSEQISEAYGDAERARKRLFNEVHKAALAAHRLGMSKPEVVSTLNSAGVARDASVAILNGLYEPYLPSTQMMQQIAKLPGGPGRVKAIRESAIAARKGEAISRLQAAR